MKFSELVEKYVELRDRKAQMKAQYEADVLAVDQKLDKIELAMLTAFNQLGLDSIKTPFGTAYASVRTTASVSDRDAFMKHVKENNDWSLLEVRAAKAAVEQYKAANEDQLPPGISWRAEKVVNFRRSS